MLFNIFSSDLRQLGKAHNLFYLRHILLTNPLIKQIISGDINK